MRLLVIDGGGTSTDVAVCDGIAVVARTLLPSAKPTPSDSKTDELCRMLGSFLATSPLDHSDEAPLHTVIIGMAGVWSARERYAYAGALASSWQTYVSTKAVQFVVLSDAELALAAAHGNAHGAIMIAGTGSIMLMRDNDGALHRVGGWGPQIDDAGGGIWLGRQACMAVARMLDGRGPSTQLIRPVASYLRVDSDDHDAVRNALRSTPSPAFARIGAAVLQYADEYDAVAMSIRDEGARELSLLLASLPESTDVVVYGSLLGNEGYRTLVGRYAGRTLRPMDDVVVWLAGTIDRAGNLPSSAV